MATTLLGGMQERDSAKRRRQEDYKQDLELQMREKVAAKQREKLQDMAVDATGWLDPEKRPDRLKPLGGVHWTQQRGRRDERVKPYHTLFMYGKDDREPRRGSGMAGESLQEHSARLPFDPQLTARGPHYVVAEGDERGQEVLLTDRPRAPVRTPPGLRYQPLTYAGAGIMPADQAYSYTGARDLGYGGGGGSLVQPVTLPYPDTRPIIIQGGGGGGGSHTTRTVVEYRDDPGTARELRNLLGVVQSEKDRMRRDNDEFQRKLLRNMEDEKRRLHDQEEEARRRMERLRREAEENRKEAERQKREAERLRLEALTRPKSARPATPKAPFYDWDEHRRRMEADRKRMEDLMKAANKPKVKDIWDVQIVKKPKFHLDLPPTPSSADRANRDNVRDFNNLKHRDFNQRDEFRQVFPDVPVTNRRLEEQQAALLRHQESNSRGYHTDRPRKKRTVEIEPRRSASRPGWMDEKYSSRKLTEYTSNSDSSPRHRGKLMLRDHRKYSTDTLTDDTWIQPSDADYLN